MRRTTRHGRDAHRGVTSLIRRWAAVLAIPGLAALLTFAATSGTASGAAKAKTVSIGVIGDKSTDIVSEPGMEGVVKAAARAVNAAGGWAGDKINVIYCDEQANATQSTACANEFVSDHVVAVTGILLFDTTFDPILKAAGIPLVGLTGPDPISTGVGDNLVYPTDAGSVYSYEVALAYEAHKGLKLSAEAEDVPQVSGLLQLLDAVYAQAQPGGAFANTVLVPPTATDFSPIVASAEANGANGSFVFLGAPGTTAFMQAAETASAPFSVYIMPDDFTSTEISAFSGDNALIDKGVFGGAYPPPAANTPGMKMYRAELAAEVKAGDSSAKLSNMDVNTMPPYLAVHGIAEALKADKAKTVTAATITAALNKAKNLNMFGIIPPWTPSKPAPSYLAPLAPRASNADDYIVGFKNGKEVALTKDETLAQYLAGKS